MNRAERLDRARSQLKMTPPLSAKLMKARQPKRSWRMMTGTGRPFLSIDAKALGAIPDGKRLISFQGRLCFGVKLNIPCAARAWIVLVEPKVHELATLRTEIRMTALKMEGRTLMPASWMAMTKGEWRDDDPSPVYRGLSAGTFRPMRKRLTM